MGINKQVLVLSISAIIGMNYVRSANATDHPIINGGTTRLNDGDQVTFDDSTNTSNIIGINLSSSTESVTITGAANVNVNSGGQTTGVSSTGGSSLDLGSGTVITNTGGTGLIYGLVIKDSNTTVNGNNLTVNSSGNAGYVKGIVAENGASVHFTGDTVVNATSTQAGTGFVQGVNLDTGSSLTFDKLTLNVNNNGSGGGVVVSGGSSLMLGSGSSITVDSSNALFATGATTSVSINNTTLVSKNGYGVNAQVGANVNLGSNTHISNSGNSMGIWAVNSGKVIGDHLTLNSSGAQGAIEADQGGSIEIGAGSYVTSSSIGIAATANSTIKFKGSATERNTLNTHSQYAVSSQGSNGVTEIENTDVTVDNVNGSSGSVFLGVFAANRGVVNVKDSSISIAEGGAAVYSMNRGVVNLSGTTVINAGSNSKSALATQGSNAVINVTDQAIINGNIFASGAGSAISLDTTQDSVFTGYTKIDTVAPGATLDIKMANGTWNMTNNSQVNNLVLNNSVLNFSNAGYETLTIDSLSGANGLF